MSRGNFAPNQIHPDDYDGHFTEWLINELDRKNIRYQTFAKEVGIPGGGRSFRLIRKGERKWSLRDICLVAKYFDEPTSVILAKSELFKKIRENN